MGRELKTGFKITSGKSELAVSSWVTNVDQGANLAGKEGCGRQAERRAGTPALLRGHTGRSEGVGWALWGCGAPVLSVGCAALLAAAGPGAALPGRTALSARSGSTELCAEQ